LKAVTGPDPAVAAVRSAVRDELADLPPGGLVLVACSGGADSLALAAATAFVAARAGITAGAVVVDHGWRPDSAADAGRAAVACRSLGLAPVEQIAVDVAGPGGPEAAARTARYAALDDAAARHRADAVLLGHTLDDQAETVLLGLARGSGARALAGMPARRGVFRRPLLRLPRTLTRRACTSLGLQPLDDPANDDEAYARVRVRRAMALLAEALGEGLVPALARTADLLREDAGALDALAHQLLAASVRADADPALGGSLLSLDVATLTAAPAAIRRRALLAAIRQAGAPGSALGRRHILAVDALLVAWHGQGPVHLPGRLIARRDCGRLALAGWSATGDGPGMARTAGAADDRRPLTEQE
jgi:tRNA(Ile)-lysidine synthetase-like protein